LADLKGYLSFEIDGWPTKIAVRLTLRGQWATPAHPPHTANEEQTVEQGIACIKRERYRTEIEVGGHLLVADEEQARGGANAGPAPFDLLLASLSACTAMTLRRHADLENWPLESLYVFVRLVRGADGMRIERMLAMTGVHEMHKAKLLGIADETPLTVTLRACLPIFTELA
jgi:putative redox protein